MKKKILWQGCILGNPVTKKNSQRIVKHGNRYTIIPSKAYKEYERIAGYSLINKPSKPISETVNVKCIYYMQNNRRVDLVNLQEATLDILVKYGILEDDNRNIVASMDNSRVYVDREKPRVEIVIESLEGKNE